MVTTACFPVQSLKRSGQRLLVRVSNRLQHPIVTHLHGGRTEPGSDGYPTDMVAPLAAGATLPSLEQTVAGARGNGWKVYDYANQQRATMLWYHDHRMDYTGQQVWKGLAGVYLLRDDEEDGLALPAGEREIVLVLTDRSFAASGALRYPVDQHGMLDPAYMGGVMGDVMLVNGAPWPTHRVQTGLYRLRILNACNARECTLEFDRGLPAGYQFGQIGTDGGLLQHISPRRQITLAPAERVDVLVNFSGCALNQPIRLLNTQGEGRMGVVMQWLPVDKIDEPSRLPHLLGSSAPPAPTTGMVERSFDFKYLRRKGIWTINGLPYDTNRIDARPRLNSTEIWHLRSDFTHPVHLHLVHFGVLHHDGKPTVADMGWKDTIRLVAGETSTIIVPFTGFTGRYVFHCHNLEHEDMRMMANFEVVS